LIAEFDATDEATISDAVRADVSAYVVDGIAAQRVKPILDFAIAQFRTFQGLKDELAAAKLTLVNRKVVERAKGLLRKQRGCTEVEAYSDMRRLAMNRGVRIGEIADSIIAVTELLSK
jgi:two-component system, response regulator / RNA-binding antiterminator